MPEASTWNHMIIDQFRANPGGAAGPFKAGMLLLLHHHGRRSGAERVTPLIYQQVGDAYAVFASNSGAEHDPQWYRNLHADPAATIELGTGETIPVTARTLPDDERDPIWQRQKQLQPSYAGYEQRTARTIPVVLLEPVAQRG